MKTHYIIIFSEKSIRNFLKLEKKSNKTKLKENKNTIILRKIGEKTKYLFYFIKKQILLEVIEIIIK